MTLSFLLQRELGAGDALAYLAAQVAGGIAGTWCAHAAFEEPVLMLSRTSPAVGLHITAAYWFTCRRRSPIRR